MLPARARKILADGDTNRLLSVMSLTEIAIKKSINKIEISAGQVTQLLIDQRLTVLPFTSSHAMRLFDLPLHHTDPFDRMIVATALAEGVPLIGGDNLFALYKQEGLSIIWK